MYKCLACDLLFHTPICQQKYDEGYTYYESGCPYCGEDFEEIEECQNCFNIVPTSRLEFGYCEECQHKLTKKMANLIKRNFTPQEFDILDALGMLVEPTHFFDEDEPGLWDDASTQAAACEN